MLVPAAGLRVRYIPRHARGDARHRDCEDGTVTGVSCDFVFVRFDGAHPDSPGKACDACDLLWLGALELAG